jgi:hypothetical protein
MRIRLLPLPVLCVILVGCPGPDAGRPPNGGPPLQAQHPYQDFPSWPEALQWLKASGNPAALASNRFDSTQEAIDLIQRLYGAGALRVAILADTIMSDAETLQDEGGPYADTIVIKLPEDPARRDRVIELCRPEFAHECTTEVESVWGDYVCIFWD